MAARRAVKSGAQRRIRSYRRVLWRGRCEGLVRFRESAYFYANNYSRTVYTLKIVYYCNYSSMDNAQTNIGATDYFRNLREKRPILPTKINRVKSADHSNPSLDPPLYPAFYNVLLLFIYVQFKRRFEACRRKLETLYFLGSFITLMRQFVFIYKAPELVASPGPEPVDFCFWHFNIYKRRFVLKQKTNRKSYYYSEINENRVTIIIINVRNKLFTKCFFLQLKISEQQPDNSNVLIVQKQEKTI